MKKLMVGIAVCAACMAAAAAVEEGLQQAANDPSVAQMAEEDINGVQVFADGNGGFKLISCGTGTYDFTDEDEIADAVKEATRNAKAHITKFFKENFKTAEDATNATKKAKSLRSDGGSESASISKETVKTVVEAFHSDSQKVLSGIVPLKEQRVPSSKKGGKILVTVGWSSLTQAAATTIDDGMSPKPPVVTRPPDTPENTPYVRKPRRPPVF